MKKVFKSFLIVVVLGGLIVSIPQTDGADPTNPVNTHSETIKRDPTNPVNP